MTAQTIRLVRNIDSMVSSTVLIDVSITLALIRKTSKMMISSNRLSLNLTYCLTIRTCQTITQCLTNNNCRLYPTSRTSQTISLIIHLTNTSTYLLLLSRMRQTTSLKLIPTSRILLTITTILYRTSCSPSLYLTIRTCQTTSRFYLMQATRIQRLLTFRTSQTTLLRLLTQIKQTRPDYHH